MRFMRKLDGRKTRRDCIRDEVFRERHMKIFDEVMHEVQLG